MKVRRKVAGIYTKTDIRCGEKSYGAIKEKQSMRQTIKVMGGYKMMKKNKAKENVRYRVDSACGVKAFSGRFMTWLSLLRPDYLYVH